MISGEIISRASLVGRECTDSEASQIGGEEEEEEVKGEVGGGESGGEAEMVISELVVVGVSGDGGQRPMCDMEAEQVVQVADEGWLPTSLHSGKGRANAADDDKDDNITTVGRLVLGKLAYAASSLMQLAKDLFVSTMSSSWLTMLDWLVFSLSNNNVMHDW